MSANSYVREYANRLKSMFSDTAKHIGNVAQEAASDLIDVGKTVAHAKAVTIKDREMQNAANQALDIFAQSAHKIIGKYDGAYENWIGVTGASDCGCKNGWIGSAEMDLSTAKDYIDSKNAKTKDTIIDEIIKVVDSLGLKVSGSSREEKVKALLSVIPSGDKFNSSNEAHRRICSKIAEALNSIHGSQIINITAAPELVCQQVAEIVSSLAAAMHSEFLAVYSDVKKILKNLEVLRRSIIDDHNELKRRINSSDDASLVKETAQLNDLHSIITDEIDRQIKLLQNLLNITLFPAERELASLIKGQKDIYGYIEKIDTKPGNKGFGKVISDILKGLGITANFALLIDRALKSIGMSVDEYVKTDSVSKLREKITSGLMGKELDPAKLHEYLQAAELLYKNFSRKEDIASVMSANKIGNFEDNIAEPGMDGAMLGGADRYAKSTLDKRIEDRRKLRNLIFTAFYRRLDDIYTALMTSMEILAKKVGSEIPLSDQLDNFRYIVQRIDENLLRSKNVYQALIGYYSDALSKNRRDSILADLKMVSSQIDTIVEMSVYQSSAKYFKDVQSQINALFEVVNKFSDEIAAKFGKGEECEHIEDKVGEGESDSDSESRFGGDDFIDEPKTIIRSAKKIMDSFRKFDYYYKVAQIRANLGRTSKELDHYGEKYDKLVANSIADYLEKRKREYEELRKEINSLPDNLVSDGNIVFQSGAVEIATDEDKKAEKANATKFMDMQWESLKKFWATVEAVDNYMRVFTNGLVKNIDDVQDIKSMLDEVEIISNWYNESAGDGVARVFDMFPSFVFHEPAAVPRQVVTYPNDSIVNDTADHYYEKFSDVVNSDKAKLPGNPLLMTTATRGLQARDGIKRTMMSLSILKNLISVFVHIGSKFGGVELKSKIFMSPAQIYNNLVEYLQMSSFYQGWKGYQNVNHYPPTFVSGANQVEYRGGQYLGIKIDDFGDVYDEAITDGLLSFDGYDSIVGAGTTDIDNDAMRYKQLFGVGMRHVADALRERAHITFNEEDMYFVHVMKAMAAKILTVTGMYDVIDRPFENNAFNPIRMIVGGLDETPKVDENVTELYLRLPLLAQFYKRIFGYDEDKGEYDENNKFEQTVLPGREDNMLKISLVPDFDGVFAGFIRLIFRQIKYINTAAYNEEDIKAIIREINLIYQRMQSKYPQNTISETINEFVSEVNRRYGIVSRTERNKFEKEFGYRYDYSEGNTATGDRYDATADVDVAILPGEGEEEIVRLSGAQKLLSGTPFDDKPPIASNYGLNNDQYNLLLRFRCAIDKLFENPAEENTFKNAIKHAQKKLKVESDDTKRLKIVAELMRGHDALGKSDELKYFMFHETVIAGLNTLSALHSLLSRFKRKISIIDIISHEKELLEYITTPGNQVSMHDVVNNTVHKLLSRINTDDNQESLLYDTNPIFGYCENYEQFGGSGAQYTYILKHKNGIPGKDISRDTRLPIRTFTMVAAHSVNYPDVPVNNITCTNNITVPMIPNAQTGLLGLLSGIDITSSVENYKRGKNLTSDGVRAVATVTRYVFNYELVMKELLESVFAIANDSQGLITMKLENGRLLLNFGPIKALIEELFTHVNYFLDVLRPHVNVDILKKYTEKTNPGSLYWLQEQLMEKLIYGRPEEHATINPKPRYYNIDDIGRTVDALFVHLTKEYPVDGMLLSMVNPSAVHVSNEITSRNAYDKVFAELIFYNSAIRLSGVRNNSAQVAAELIDFKGLANPYETLHFFGQPDKKTLDTRFIMRFTQLYSWDKKLKPNRSLLFVYNQMVAKFIRCFYDNLTQKMYGGLILPQINGPLNRAINDYKSTYSDVTPAYIVKAEREAVKYPNSNLLSTNPVISQSSINLLRTVIKTLLTEGIGSHKTLAKRAVLLDPTMPHFTTTDAITGIPHIISYIMVYLVATICDMAMERDPTVWLRAYSALNPAANNAANTAAIWNVNKFVKQISALSNADLLLRIFNINTLFNVTPQIINGSDLLFNWVVLAGAPDNVYFGAGTDFAKIMYAICRRIITGAGAAYTYLPSVPLFTEGAKLNYPFYKDMVSDQFAIDSRIELFCAIFDRAYDAHKKSQSIAPVNFANARAEFDRHILAVKKDITAVPQVVVSRKAEPKMQLKYEDSLLYLNTDVNSDYIDFSVSQNHIRVVSNDADGPAGSGEAWGFIGETAKPLTRNQMVSFGQRLDPDEDHILFTSLSVILKTLFLSRNASNNASIYLVDNISDVNQYMKERFRANLPIFKSYFKEIVDKCEFLRLALGQTSMYVHRTYTECNRAPTHNPWPFNLLQLTTGNDDTKQRFTSILTGISNQAKSFVSACDQVMRELSDDPKFMELNQGFIKDYKSQHGVEPFMPLSSLLNVFRNVFSDTDDISTPVHFYGDKQFKFVYGTRMLLNQPSIQPLIDHVPGWAASCENFNMMIDTKQQADKTKAEAFMRALVKSIRFVYGAKFIRGNITPYTYHSGSLTGYETDRKDAYSGMFARGNFVVTSMMYSGGLDRDRVIGHTYHSRNIMVPTNNSTVSIIGDTRLLSEVDNSKVAKMPIAVYSISKDLESVIQLTEGGFKDDQIKKIIDHILGKKSTGNSLEVQNIVDLNIIPINVHALMREIPLVNIMNYSYTFNRLAIELYYGSGTAEAKDRIKSLCDAVDMPINDSRDMMVKLLIRPYEMMTIKHNGITKYYSHVRDMMLGTHIHGLGRPKFLSDQLLNKSLFGEMYESKDRYTDVGPVNKLRCLDVAFAGDLIKIPAELFPRSAHWGDFIALYFGPVNADELNTFANIINAVLKYVSKNENKFSVIFNKILDGPLQDFPTNPVLNALNLVGNVEAIRRLAYWVTAFCIAFGEPYKLYKRGKIDETTAGYASLLILEILETYPIRVVSSSLYPNNNPHEMAQMILYYLVHNTLGPTADQLSKPVPEPNPALPNSWHRLKALVPGVVLTDIQSKNLLETLKNIIPIFVSGEHIMSADGNAGPAGTNPTFALQIYIRQADALRDNEPVYKSLQWLSKSTIDGETPYDPSQIKSVNVAAISQELHAVGKLRFDTMFVRNLIFIVNLYRTVRLKLNKDLTYNRDIIAKSQVVTKPSITEFASNETYADPASYLSHKRYNRYQY